MADYKGAFLLANELSSLDARHYDPNDRSRDIVEFAAIAWNRYPDDKRQLQPRPHFLASWLGLHNMDDDDVRSYFRVFGKGRKGMLCCIRFLREDFDMLEKANDRGPRQA